MITVINLDEKPVNMPHHNLSRPDVIPVFDQQDGSLLGTMPAMSRDDVELVIQASTRAFEQMRRLPLYTRRTILNQVAELISSERDEFAHLIAREGIKTIREARREVGRCVDTLRLCAAEIRHLPQQLIPFDQAPGSEARFGYYRRLPRGVVTAITPYNDPLNLIAHKVGPALATGNAVILKPHMETPLTAARLVALFREAGLPEDALQLVTGHDAEIGEPLVADPRVNMISFTGGFATGEKLQLLAGIKKIAMELGGNCACLVLADANLEQALTACVSGAFSAAGQNCLHVQRIFIHDSLYEEFAAAFCQRAGRLRMGSKLLESTDMGPMINEQAAQRAEALARDAVEKGANLLCGGFSQGCQFPPTVLEAVSDDAVIDREEAFAPITALYRFSRLEEALAKINSSRYGLQTGIFTNDLNQAFQIADAIDCGAVIINDSSDYRIDAMPFGGSKHSGLGREGVAFTMAEMTELKTYCFNLGTPPGTPPLQEIK